MPCKPLCATWAAAAVRTQNCLPPSGPQPQYAAPRCPSCHLGRSHSTHEEVICLAPSGPQPQYTPPIWGPCLMPSGPQPQYATESDPTPSAIWAAAAVRTRQKDRRSLQCHRGRSRKDTCKYITTSIYIHINTYKFIHIYNLFRGSKFCF